MNIECPYCKKEIDKHSKQCEFCGREIQEAYAANFFNGRKEEYDRRRALLILVMSCIVCGLVSIYSIIRRFAAIRHDDPSYCIPYLVAAGIGTLIVCITLWIYYSHKMKFYQAEISSVLNEKIEKCGNCGRYKLKDKECLCRTGYYR